MSYFIILQQDKTVKTAMLVNSLKDTYGANTEPMASPNRVQMACGITLKYQQQRSCRKLPIAFWFSLA